MEGMCMGLTVKKREVIPGMYARRATMDI